MQEDTNPQPSTPTPQGPSSKQARPTGRLTAYLGGCLSSVVLLVVGTIGLIVTLCLCISNEGDNAFNTDKLPSIVTIPLSEGSTNTPAIAVIEVKGAIGGGNSTNSSAGSDTLVRLLNHVATDKKYGSLILNVDSPGGEVTASDVIYDAVKRVQKAGKPVVVMMGTMACSGGYYISAPANWIVAHPTTWTGSIGVIISGINYEEGLGKLGIRPEVFKSGDFKDMLSGARTMRDDEKDYVQSMVLQSYDRFVQIVCDGRNLDRTVLEQKHAIDGRVLSAPLAQQVGLVDQLGYFRDAVAKAKELTSATETPAVVLVKEKSAFPDFLSSLSMGASASKNITVSLGNGQLPTLRPGVPYALPASYANGVVISAQ